MYVGNVDTGVKGKAYLPKYAFAGKKTLRLVFWNTFFVFCRSFTEIKLMLLTISVFIIGFVYASNHAG